MIDHCPACGFVLPETKRRSQQTHNHYFAAIHDAWQNLPEDISGEFPSPEHLRKYALIKAGYCTCQNIVCATNKTAIEAGAIVMGIDEFAICSVVGQVVTVYRAQSQSYKAMGKVAFAKSKSDVLEVLSGMVGANVSEHAGEAA
jgi:hypothetical protein